VQHSPNKTEIVYFTTLKTADNGLSITVGDKCIDPI